MMIGTSNSITLRGLASFTTPPNLYTSNSVSRVATFSPSPSIRATSRILHTPISAVGSNSGLEASVTNSNDISVLLTDATVVLQEQGDDENKIQLRVELNGVQTRKVFDRILVNLGQNVPPTPGFRTRKGGKTAEIPKSFLLQVLGEESVTKFAIQEILNCTMAEYVKKENLDAEDKKVRTIQTVQELRKSFTAGKQFGFDVIIEPKNNEGNQIDG
ncbi:uncharacterized protein LOC131602084 [Vicia villosa]|uniref:uncharacterized protein LOC131602084 n=1 Tax=Vicia villosa TaxID=3911 RepID=UPI00273B0EF1|nr:uncharacterized protein LOC131602084 [Vicia villosa]